MGLLQDPRKALDQAEEYLNNRNGEKFPGAAELAAGNLCRQTLEQILFILCFFSRMPRNRYLKSNRTLHTAGHMVQELDKRDPAAGRLYWALARKRGPRIRKFARRPRTIKAWQRKLNEPSHFAVNFRKVDEAWLRAFIGQARLLFDDLDNNLIVVALNDLFSNGRIQATLSSDRINRPSVLEKVIVKSTHLRRDDSGRLTFLVPQQDVQVISDREVPRGAWPRILVVAQGTGGFRIAAQFVTNKGDTIDMTSMETIVESLGKTRGQRSAVTRRFRQLGLKIEWVKTDVTKKRMPA